MSDVFTKAKRSEVMSLIRSRGNKNTELVVVRLLRANQISGWRRHLEIQNLGFGIRRLKVRPDFVFHKSRMALFVDGCFWHGCPKHSRQPKSNRTFWRRKFSANKKRDLLVTRVLRQAGWHVLRIWEHNLARPERCISRIRRTLELPVK